MLETEPATFWCIAISLWGWTGWPFSPTSWACRRSCLCFTYLSVAAHSKGLEDLVHRCLPAEQAKEAKLLTLVIFLIFFRMKAFVVVLLLLFMLRCWNIILVSVINVYIINDIVLYIIYIKGRQCGIMVRSWDLRLRRPVQIYHETVNDLGLFSLCSLPPRVLVKIKWQKQGTRTPP